MTAHLCRSLLVLTTKLLVFGNGSVVAMGQNFLVEPKGKRVSCTWVTQVPEKTSKRCLRNLSGSNKHVSSMCPTECNTSDPSPVAITPRIPTSAPVHTPTSSQLINDLLSSNPSNAPSSVPSLEPSNAPSMAPSGEPSLSNVPSLSMAPSGEPSSEPSSSPAIDQTPTVGSISVVGTSWTTTRKGNKAAIAVPDVTAQNDVLVLFVGGSGTPKSGFPSVPMPDFGWNKIVGLGSKDINLNAYLKVVTNNNRQSSYSIDAGPALFISMVVLRGVDLSFPVVDAQIAEDTLPGVLGDALAPEVNTTKGGIVLVSVAYDDSHVATVREAGFSTLLTFKAATQDGMVVGASNQATDDDGAGPVFITSNKFAEGQGEEVATSISFRAGAVAGTATQDINTADFRGIIVDDMDNMICGDGTPVVPGEIFCYIQRDYSGDAPVEIINVAESCSFFEVDTSGYATHLQTHCTPTSTENPGAEFCPACAYYLDTPLPL